MSVQNYINIIVTKRTGSVWVASLIREWCPNVEVVRFENAYPQDCYPFGTIVLQTRDLLNWYASYFTSVKGKTSSNVIHSWWEIAKEFYTPTYLTKRKVIRVLYDAFFENRIYREDVCTQLNGTYSENRLQDVVDAGGGSSFTNTSMHKQAQLMPVLKRYKMVDPDIYIQLFASNTKLLQFYTENMMNVETEKFLVSIGVLKEKTARG